MGAAQSDAARRQSHSGHTDHTDHNDHNGHNGHHGRNGHNGRDDGHGDRDRDRGNENSESDSSHTLPTPRSLVKVAGRARPAADESFEEANVPLHHRQRSVQPSAPPAPAQQSNTRDAGGLLPYPKLEGFEAQVLRHCLVEGERKGEGGEWKGGSERARQIQSQKSKRETQTERDREEKEGETENVIAVHPLWLNKCHKTESPFRGLYEIPTDMWKEKAMKA